ncbi:MAG: UDP-N-acetylglucosamine 2-epimerase (non-hydrolyzing) [Bacteroidota bacterium]
MIISIVGARPQFVKAAVVSKAFRENGIPEKIVHTGQHYDTRMSEVFWTELGLPSYDINLEVGSGSHGKQTALMIEKIESYLLACDPLPRAILLYGDTNSTIAGAIAASKIHIPIIHVEAGLRSFNRRMPEEINRIVTDHLSEILFCSSDSPVNQLETEGITKGVYEVGDVMYDAMATFSEIAKSKINLTDVIPFPEGDFALATIHRPSNTDNIDNLNSILSAIAEIGMPCIWPVHPRNKKKIAELDLPSNLYPVEPVSYLEMLILLSHCTKVFTDSGGLQKEAYWMKKPCITLREETEWIETLENGWNVITGSNKSAILDAANNPPDPDSWKPVYGDGRASVRIAEIVKKQYAY